MRILFITNTPPVPSWGGAMTFFRHFCERKDFEISVITDDHSIEKYELPYVWQTVERSKLWKRVSNSRFYYHLQTYDKLVGVIRIPSSIEKEVKRFKPDAVFTVAGSWNRMAIIAGKVAKKYNIPLIGSFNDWWYYASAFLPDYAPQIEAKFRAFYRQCDLAICTSEGMLEELGEHPNAVVIYPTGARIDTEKKLELKQENNATFHVAFGGSLADWYGRMLESLVCESKGSWIRFSIFGSNPSWSKEFDQYAREVGIYKGHVSFEQLSEEMDKVDGLLLLMGFGEKEALIEKTSFKTKFLDYLTFRKPILLWGPEYCSAVKVAHEFQSAEICTFETAADFLKLIERVSANELLRKKLVNNAVEMYHQRFNPDKLHEELKKRIYSLKR